MKTIVKLLSVAMLLLISVNANAQKVQKIKVSQDAFVQGGETADEPMGVTTSDRLRVMKSTGDSKYSRITYLQFNLKKVAVINDVELNVCVKVYESKDDASAQFSMDVMACEDNKWSENSITFNNKPEVGELLASVVVPTNENNEWVKISIPAEKIKELKDKKGKVTLVIYNTDFNRTSGEIISKERTWSNGSPAKREAFLSVK